MNARIRRISGALADVAPMRDASLYELVRVGKSALMGEVVRIDGDVAVVQVFEETSGLTLGEPVERTGAALTAELGPGLIGSILDGVGRPLVRIAEETGSFIAPGTSALSLDRARRFVFQPTLEVGSRVEGGDVLGTVEERPGFLHRIMVPPGIAGPLARMESGEHGIDDPIGALQDGTPLYLFHRWPVRTARPCTRKLASDRPFVTGQRVFDLLFPIAEGGAVAVPGGFGTGKTVIEQSLAKYGAADVVVYIGCGERGNEMAELLEEFPRLEDPDRGRSIMDRTVMIVNTSNMPVAARESSIYLGMTIAEYYRDQGLRVAVMADSLSRWAEALRELGARLGEMPGEEGYPTYLASRLGRLYERAGAIEAKGAPKRNGALTFISAVSPPGGDLSEPVTQASLRVAGALWALDPALAHQRHFPAVDWETSYSAYAESTAVWFAARTDRDWASLRREILELLARERELREIAGLVGVDALEDPDRLVLETARIARELVVGQSAFDPNDARSPVEKTHRLAFLAMKLHRSALAAIGAGRPFASIDLASARTALLRARSASEGAAFDEAKRAIERCIS